MTDDDDLGVYRERGTTIITTQSRPRLVWWRDLVLLLLVAAVLLLVLEGREDRRTIEQVRTGEMTAQAQRAALADKLDDVVLEVARTQLQADRKDAEIARLNALLQSLGVDPGPSLADSNGDGDNDLGGSTDPAPAPQPTTTRPSTPASPRPTPSPTRTPPRPTPQPTPTAEQPLLCQLAPVPLLCP